MFPGETLPRITHLKPQRHPSVHGLAAAMLATPTQERVALWVGDVGVLFYNSGPVVLFEHGRLHLRPGLHTRSIRHIAKWLADNHLPSLAGITPTPNFFELVTRCVCSELLLILRQDSSVAI